MPSRLKAFWSQGRSPFTPHNTEEFQRDLIREIERMLPKKSTIATRELVGGKLRLGITIPGIRSMQKGNEVANQLIFDVEPVGGDPFGAPSIAMTYPTGWQRTFNPVIVGRSTEDIEFMTPARYLASYIEGILPKRGQTIQGTLQARFERAVARPELYNINLPGGAPLIGPWHSEEARAEMASRVRVAIPEGEYMDPYISAITERITHARSLGVRAWSDPQQSAFASMMGYAPVKEQTGEVVWRRFGEVTEGSELALLGKPGKWFKHANIANLIYGNVRERAGLYTMGTDVEGMATGLEEIEPQFITGAGFRQTAGYRWSNMLGPAGQRLSGVVSPNTAFVPGFPYSGSSMFYRDVFNTPGSPPLYSAGIQHREFIRLPFSEDVRMLRGAQFEFGQFDVQRDEGGRITGYTRTGELKNVLLEPGERRTIGMATYERGGKTMYEPIDVVGGSGMTSISGFQLQLPFDYSAGTGRGMGGLATLEAEQAGIHQAGGLLTTVPLMEELQAAHPGLDIMRGTRGEVGILATGVMETAAEWKGVGGVKTASMEISRGFAESQNVSVMIGQAQQVLSAVTDAVKNPLEQYKWQFGFSSPAMQRRWAGVFGGTLGTRLQEYIAGVNKDYATTGIPGAVDPEEMGRIYALERGVPYQENISQYEMFQEMMGLMEKTPPTESWRKYRWAAGFDPQPIRAGYISSSQRAVLRQSATDALQMKLQEALGPDVPALPITTKAGTRQFQGIFGMTPRTMREQVLRFNRPIRSSGAPPPAAWQWSINAPFNIGNLVMAATPGFAAGPGKGAGLEELAAIMSEQPVMAREMGADLGMTLQEQIATQRVSEPPHQRAWRNIIETVRANAEGPLTLRKPGSYTDLTPEQVQQVSQALLVNPDTPLEEIQQMLGGETMWRNPYTGLYFPTAGNMIDVTKYRYSEHEMQTMVTGLSYRYQNALPDFFTTQPVSQQGSGYSKSVQSFLGNLQEIVEAKGVQKLQQQRMISGLMGGRYGADPSLELFEMALNPETSRRALRDIGRSAGLSGEELSRWMGLAEQSMQVFGIGEPVVGREQGLLMSAFTPEQLKQQRGLEIPSPSQVVGGRPRYGSPIATGIMGSMSAIMGAVGRDWDYDFAFALMAGRFDREKGLVFPEGFKPPSKMDWYEQVNLYNQTKQALYSSETKYDPIVGAMRDLFAGREQLMGRGAQYLSRMPFAQLVREGRLLTQSIMGMGISYNMRRAMEASASSLGMSPSQISMGHSASAQSYQPYLDKIIKEIEDRGGFTNLETLMSSAMFTEVNNEAQMIGIMRPGQRWSRLWQSSTSTVEDFTQRLAPALAQIVEEDIKDPTLAAFYLGTPQIPIGGLIEKFEQQGIRRTVEEMVQVGTGRPGIAGSLEEYFGLPVPEGGGSLYDVQQSPLGLNLIGTATLRTAGAYGRFPKMVTMESGETIPINTRIQGLVFPAGRVRRQTFTRQHAERETSAFFPHLSGEQREAKINEYMTQWNIAPEAMLSVDQLRAAPAISRFEGLYGFMTRAAGGPMTWQQREMLQWQATSLQAQGREVPLMTLAALNTYQANVGQPLPESWTRGFGLGPEASLNWSATDVANVGPSGLHGRSRVDRGTPQPTGTGDGGGIPIPPQGGGTGTAEPGGEPEYFPYVVRGQVTTSGISRVSNLGNILAGGGGGTAEDMMIALRAIMGDEEAMLRMDVRHIHQGQGMLTQQAERRMRGTFAAIKAMEGRGMGEWGSQLLQSLSRASGVTIDEYLQGGLEEAIGTITQDPRVARLTLGPQASTIREMATFWKKAEASFKAYSQENWAGVPEPIRAALTSIVNRQGEFAQLGGAAYSASIVQEALENIGLGTKGAMSLRGETGESVAAFTERIEEATQRLRDFDDRLATTTDEMEKYKIAHEKQAYELEQFRLPEQKYRVEQLRKDIDSGLLTETDKRRVSAELGVAQRQLSATERAIAREQELVEDPTKGAFRPREMASAMRRLIGGWGLFYLGHLANFPRGVWEYGMAEGQQYAMQQESYMGGIMGISDYSSYAQVQNQIAQARIVSGGLPGAYLQQRATGVPGGIRDIGGSLMAGAAGYAMSLYVGQAVGGSFGALATGIAPMLGLTALAGGLAVAQASYSQYPEQTIARMMIDQRRAREGGFGGTMAGLSRWFQQGPTYANYEGRGPTSDELLFALENQLVGQEPIYRYLTPERAPFIASRGGRDMTRPLTQSEIGIMATALQEMPGLTGLDPNILSQTYSRWTAGGRAIPNMEQRLRETVLAQMGGVPIPEMAQMYQQALRMPMGLNVGLETALTQALPTIYQAAGFQSGAAVVGAMPAPQIPMYITGQTEQERINQIMEMRMYQRTGMDFFLGQQGDLIQQAWAWGLPTDYEQIPTDAGPLQRRGISIQQQRSRQGQQLLQQYYTLGMRTPFMEMMSRRPAGIAPTPAELATMGRTVQGTSAFIQSQIPSGWFTPDQVGQMFATPGGTALAMGATDLFTRLQQAGLDTSIAQGAFTNFGQQALANMATTQGVALAGMGISPAQINPIMNQMMQGYGSAAFIGQMFQGNPLTMTQAAAGMPYGAPGSTSYQWSLLNATMGSDMFGQVNGLPLFQESLWQGSITPQQTAARIFGQNWAQSAGVRAGVYGWNITQGRQARPGELGQPGVVGGLWGMQARMNQISYNAQMAQIGTQMAQLNLSYAFQTGIGLDAYNTVDPRTGERFNIPAGGFWGIEDRQRDLANRQAQWGFEYQERQFAMQGTQFMENWLLNRQQSQMQRGWTQADWSYQDQVRGLQWQWQQEDFAENIRFMTGRERRLATRQMERQTTMFNLEGEQIDTQRSRQREMWELEDERFDMQKRHFEEQRQLLEENMEKQKEFYEEGRELQEQATELQRAYFIENHKLQMAALGAQAGYAAEMKKAQDEMILLQQEQDKVQGKYRVAMSLEEAFINNVVAGLNHLIKHGHDLWEKIQKGTAIPGFTNPYSTDTGGDGGGEYDPGDSESPRQGGGPLMAGRRATVGEAGIEYIKARVPLSVIPNNEVQAIGMGGQTLRDPWDRNFRMQSPRGGGTAPQTIIINIGNHRLGEFVVSAVKEDLML